MIKNQFQKCVKVLRSDNGSEFLNKDCQNLCHKLGIIHQTSCTYTPQQNGFVQRKHRHLLNVARVLLFQASLTLKFWGDSILTATYLINRTPSKLLHWRSPFELLYNSPPSYDHLRTFGCLSYATDVSPSKPKFHPRAKKCILLGYAMTQKAYKLFDLDNRCVIFSRDVHFYEHIFPFSTSDSTHEDCPLPLVPSHSDYIQPTPTLPTNLSLTAPSHSPVSASPQPSLESSDSSLADTIPLSAIGCKWVFKTKLRADGSMERYKARLVAKGFNQIEGVDYTDSFSPVAKNVTVRIFLVVAASRDWPLEQLDINNAFLHGYLEEDIHMIPPDGYSVDSGLASRQWNVEFTNKIKAYGFLQSAHDHCLFVKETASGPMALLVYVDDILITGPSVFDFQQIKQHLHELFTIKDIGTAHYFLDLEISRNSSGLFVAQNKYVMDIIRDSGLCQAISATIPLPHGLKLMASSGALLSNPDTYRRLVSRLLYLGFTRPDISHSKAALHVVRYLKGCPSKGLFFPSRNSLALRAYCDADWATCPDSRRSLTGFCIFLGDALVSWKTKKQSTVSRSTVEAEYRSLVATVCELRWLSYILRDLSVPVILPIDLFCENKATLHVLVNPVFHERTKHIELDCHLVCDAYKEGFISPSFVPSSFQLADVFTKIANMYLTHLFLLALGHVIAQLRRAEANTDIPSSERRRSKGAEKKGKGKP
ncbi:UNVERIFIED_CONTAM: Retrovirus-related Pol polyprotein from transposon RE1 [Sesamum indicum]